MRSRIIFAGSPEFAVPSLRSLAGSGHEIAAVLTQPDRPAGRGRNLRLSPVKESAEQSGFQVIQPTSLGAADIQTRIKSLDPDLIVVVAYGLLLPSEILDIPRAGCINVHASILPRWRGAAPIQAALLAGDTRTGVSIMRMDTGLDTGPVFSTSETAIGAAETAAQLHDRLAVEGAQLLVRSLDGILTGSAVPEPQTDNEATYAGRISKADALIDWNCPAIEIDRRIRAYNPWPVAETLLDGLRMRCWLASPDANPESGAQPGEVIDAGGGGVIVQTGSGLIRLLELQMPGRQKMQASEFANGYDVIGKILGR